MSTQKHTQGPWKVRFDYMVTAHSKETESQEPIAMPFNFGGLNELPANARLIAAAPRMIELLKDAFIDVDSEILGEEWNKEVKGLLLSVYGKIEW